MLAELRRAELDCVISRISLGDQEADLSARILYEEPVVAVVKPDHALALGPRQITWNRALSFPWILPPPGSPIRRALQAWLAQNDLALPTCRFESVSVLANVAVLRDTDMLGLMPSRVAQHYTALGLIRPLSLSLPVALPPVALIRRLGEPASPTAEAFFISP